MGKIAFIFPGQGAQYPGMGASFYENSPEAKEVFEIATVSDRRRQRFVFQVLPKTCR